MAIAHPALLTFRLICVVSEKEELVNLVLIHVDNTNNFSPDSQQSQTSFSMGSADQNDDGRANPFDQIRSTCQNLFSTFTEKIASGWLIRSLNARNGLLFIIIFKKKKQCVSFFLFFLLNCRL